ncbi:MAG: MFS transporter, partial [archaeon]
LGEAGLINLSFFAAYGLISLPAGLLAHRYGNKPVFALGILLMTIGALFFGLVRTFTLLLPMLLIAGIGVTFIQVAANPLAQYTGPKKDYARNLNIIHSLFGFGSLIAPIIVIKMVSSGMSWRYFYYLLVALSLILLYSALKIKVPAHIRDGFSAKSIISHFKNTSVITSFIALFFYVGIEAGLAVWLITYLETIKGIDPSTGVYFLSLFWLLLAVGRLGGSHLLKEHCPKTIITTFTLLGAISLALGLYGSAAMSMVFLPLIGLFYSVMFPTIYSVAIENEPHAHSVISGILFTAVIGGAIIPYLIGIAGDRYGLTAGLSIIFLGFLIILLKGLTIKSAHVCLEDAGAEEI